MSYAYEKFCLGTLLGKINPHLLIGDIRVEDPLSAGGSDFCLMVEIFNRAWLGMDEMINLSDDADLCWGIAGCAGEYCQLLLGKKTGLLGGRELVVDSLEA
jgi:hypothetical protein